MDAVDTPLLDAVGALLLAEAGGVRGEGLGQALSREDLVNEAADHGVLAGADEVEVLALDLVHHAVHIGLGHYALHHIAVDHEGRNAVSEALADHKVTAIGQHCLVEAGNVAQQIVEAGAGDTAGGVQINAVEGLHNIHVVGDLEVGYLAFAEPLDFHIVGVIGAQRHGVVDHLGNHQHPLVELGVQLGLLLFQGRQALCLIGDLLFDGLGLCQLGGVLLGLAHQHAHLLGQPVPVGAELVRLGNGGAALAVQLDDLVHQRQLFILELLLDVFLYRLRVFPDKLYIQHFFHLINSFEWHVSRETWDQ